MVSWSKAFISAALYIAYSIGWLIIGGIFIGIGAALGTVTHPIVMLPFMLIGYAIIVFGMLAVFFKIFPEIVAEEVEKKVKPPSP